MSKICQNCWKILENENANFCPKCWHNISIEVKEEKYSKKEVVSKYIEKEIKDDNLVENTNKEDKNKTIDFASLNNNIGNQNSILTNKLIVIIILVLTFLSSIYYYYENSTSINNYIANITLFWNNDDEPVPENMPDYNTGELAKTNSWELDSNSFSWEENKINEDSSIDLDKKAELFLTDHYNSIWSHNLENAHKNYDFNVIIINWKTNPPIKNYNKFYDLWKNVTSCNISNFVKISDLTYSYDVTIKQNNWTQFIYHTEPMKLSYLDWIFKIIEYTARVKK